MTDSITLLNNKASDQFEIIGSGLLTLSHSASSTSTTASNTHNLGFIPLVIGTVVDSGFYYPLPFFNIGASTGVVAEYVYVYTDATYVGAFILTPSNGSVYSSTYTRTVKYWLLRDRSSS